MEKSRSLCAHLCLCQCSMHSFVMTWQVWLPAVVQVFPLVAAVWSPPHQSCTPVINQSLRKGLYSLTKFWNRLFSICHHNELHSNVHYAQLGWHPSTQTLCISECCVTPAFLHYAQWNALHPIRIKFLSGCARNTPCMLNYVNVKARSKSISCKFRDQFRTRGVIQVEMTQSEWATVWCSWLS